MKVTTDARVRAYDVDGRGTATLASMLHYAEDSRLALALDLHARDVSYPLRNLARVQHLVVLRPLPMLAPFTASSFLTRVGGTSFDVGTVLVSGDVVCAYVRITFVAVDDEGKKTAVSPRLATAIVDEDVPLGPGVPDVAATTAFTRTYAILPRDENSGRHVSHARLVEHASEYLRVAAIEKAVGPEAAEAVTSMSIVYERETRFPETMHVAIGARAIGAYDVVLSRAAGVVARASIITRAS